MRLRPGALGRRKRKRVDAMISLEALIADLEIAADPFAYCEVHARWEAKPASRGAVGLYFVLGGEGVIEVADGNRQPFGEGCVAICPPGARIWITPVAAKNVRQPVVCRELLGHLMSDTNCAPGGVAIVSGSIQVTFQKSAGLFDYRHEAIIEDLASSDTLRQAFVELVTEMREPRPGSSTVIECILRRCLIAILRRLWLEPGEPPHWLAALDNPRLGRVVAAMLDRPAHHHTLENLSAVAGMSRSVFAREFSSAFGRSAILFLREIRLRRAAHQLQATKHSVQSIANATGFRSRSYFSRAFKQLYGVDPATFRDRHRAAPATGGSEFDPLSSPRLAGGPR
jgi:AraC-like DNA-binding protein